jgi:hypothetical protein
MKNSNNTRINLLSIVYLFEEYNADLQIGICKTIEEYSMQFPNLSVQLQDYVFNDDLMEGCMTFTLSRRLTKTERSEFKSQWEDNTVQVQFHSVPRLF